MNFEMEADPNVSVVVVSGEIDPEIGEWLYGDDGESSPHKSSSAVEKPTQAGKRSKRGLSVVRLYHPSLQKAIDEEAAGEKSSERHTDAYTQRSDIDGQGKLFSADHEQRRICSFVACRYLHDPRHMKRFWHHCPNAQTCTLLRDERHLKHFLHEDVGMEASPMIDEVPNQVENARVTPSLSASMYQNFQPSMSCCPRGGYRPLGGIAPQSLGEQRGRKKDFLRKQDWVKVHVENLDVAWDSDDFLNNLRNMTLALIHDAKVDTIRGKPTGNGIILLSNYSDAQHLVEELTRRGMKASYSDKHSIRVKVEEEDNLYVRRQKLNNATNSKLLEINRIIRSCGPYSDDADALIRRMKFEGFQPNSNSYETLLRSLRDDDPPKASKAERVLRSICQEHIEVTPHMCNIVVDAWMRVGNIKRAEQLVMQMENRDIIEIIRTRFEGIDSEIRYKFPKPNHETYNILSDGWERAGLLDEISAIQTGYDAVDKGVLVPGTSGAYSSATSYMATWARRRSGYFPRIFGLKTSAVAYSDKDGGNFYRLSEWYPRH
mmetsp:Transcript_25175/g.83112  ORF Transcript_25175/g.83112 Transcript_25175/m.83112 type:complete len:546 (-) Transcript_25175:1056-2693(-)